MKTLLPKPLRTALRSRLRSWGYELRKIPDEQPGLVAPGELKRVSDRARETAADIRGNTHGPAIIIHGVLQRSGTNYLGNLLEMHPAVAAYPNHTVEFPFLKFMAGLEDMQRQYRQFHPELLKSMCEGDFLPLLGSATIRYLQSFIPEGQTLLLKMPEVVNIEHFFTAFPKEKLILLMRDGRDVVSSTVRSWPHFDFAEVAQNWNEAANRLLDFREELERSGHPSFLYVRYEHVVSDPRDFVESACRICELPIADYPLERAERAPVIGSSSIKEGGDVKFDPVAKPAGFKSTGRWQEWSDREKELFKRIAGASLARAGYAVDSEW